MPMTRELKKRFIEIEDRLGKVEKKKGVTNVTNVSDPSPFGFSVMVTRLDMIEKVLIMPGPKRESGQIVSGYAEIVDQLFTQLKERLDKIDSVLQMPGTQGKLSDWREVIEKQIKELREKWEPLFNVGNWIDKTEERLKELEQIPDPSSEENLKLDERVKVLQKAVEEIQLAPDPSKTILEFDDRLTELEQKPDPSSEITVSGKLLSGWVSELENRVGTLERKPVAGTLSNIAQGMEKEIKNLKDLGLDHEIELYGPEGEDNGNGLTNQIKEITQSVKTLRRKVRLVTWLSLLLFAMILGILYLV